MALSYLGVGEAYGQIACAVVASLHYFLRRAVVALEGGKSCVVS